MVCEIGSGDVKVPLLSKRELESHLEKMYHLLTQRPRMPFSTLASHMGIYSKTASKLYKEGVTAHILYPPMLRPRICTDYSEYVYILTTTDARCLFDHLSADPRVEYVTWCEGAFELLVIATQLIDFSQYPETCRLMVHGERGNYVYPEVKKRTLAFALKEMHTLMDEDPDVLRTPEEPYPARGKKWADLEETVFRYIKHDVRTPFLPLQEKLSISRTLLLKCYQRVRTHSHLVVPYFPLGFHAYTKFFLVMRSPREAQAMHILSQLPCQSTFFTLEDYLIGYTGCELHHVRALFDIMSDMCARDLISSFFYAVPIISHSR
jgi:hypothetical protein